MQTSALKLWINLSVENCDAMRNVQHVDSSSSKIIKGIYKKQPDLNACMSNSVARILTIRQSWQINTNL